MTADSTRLPPERYLELLRSDAQRMHEVAAADLDAAVPPCPGWTVRDAVEHTAVVYQHKIACMRLERRPAEGEWQSSPPEVADLLEWFDASLAELVAELTTRGPEAPAYTWHPPDQTVGFWYRRMAQETAVHRVDVESAFDAVTPVDQQLAVDGVDEVLQLMIEGDWSEDTSPEEWGHVSPDAGAGKSIVVRTGPAAWTVGLAADRIDVTVGAGRSDAVLTGEPSELLLWLWGRRGDSAVRVTGDEAAVAALRDRLKIATQ
jgi:uncharacterized protein (TIGR03083 family)